MKIRCKYTKKVPIEELVPNPRNPNTHGDEQVKLLAKIIDFQGWRSPVVVSKLSGYVVRGHGRLLAARHLGMESVPVDFQDYENEAQEHADLVADNRIAELAEMDRGTLKDLIEELDTGDLDLDLTGFDEGSLADLMSEFFVPEEGLTDADEIPEEVEPRTKTGDLWQLGDHRLLCGDATNAEDVQKVTGGQASSLLISDPPYGVDYEGPGWMSGQKKRKIKGDSGKEFERTIREAFKESEKILSSVSFLWIFVPGGRNIDKAMQIASWIDQFSLNNFCVWDKADLGMGQLMRNQWEGILFMTTGKGIKKAWKGGSSLPNVFACSQARPQKGDHPTPKPVALLETFLKATSLIRASAYDPFLGSGSTLIACEKLKRICYGIEIDPQYCDVAIQRWEDFTGKKAKKVKK